MPVNVGQYLRILGLAMETFGLASVALGARGGSRHWFGMTTDQVWSIILVGFVFWGVGTLLIHGESFRGRETDDDE